MKVIEDNTPLEKPQEPEHKTEAAGILPLAEALETLDDQELNGAYVELEDKIFLSKYDPGLDKGRKGYVWHFAQVATMDRDNYGFYTGIVYIRPIKGKRATWGRDELKKALKNGKYRIER